jgi:hypothetical protein
VLVQVLMGWCIEGRGWWRVRTICNLSFTTVKNRKTVFRKVCGKNPTELFRHAQKKAHALALRHKVEASQIRTKRSRLERVRAPIGQGQGAESAVGSRPPGRSPISEGVAPAPLKG